jgi:hypothetical protein
MVVWLDAADDASAVAVAGEVARRAEAGATTVGVMAAEGSRRPLAELAEFVGREVAPLVT